MKKVGHMFDYILNKCGVSQY